MRTTLHAWPGVEKVDRSRNRKWIQSECYNLQSLRSPRMAQTPTKNSRENGYVDPFLKTFSIYLGIEDTVFQIHQYINDANMSTVSSSFEETLETGLGFLTSQEYCSVSPLWTKHGTSVKGALWPWVQWPLFMLSLTTTGQLLHACLLLTVHGHHRSVSGNMNWSWVLVCILASGIFMAETCNHATFS